MDDLNFAKLADIDDDYIRRIETLVMGYAEPVHSPQYATDWEDTEKLISRLSELGIGVRLEFVATEKKSGFHAYLDWQDPVSLEWQTVDAEEAAAPAAVTRAALIWYYTQEMAAANSSPPDVWAYFEVLERIGIVRDLLQRSLEEHPVLQQEAEMNGLFQEVQEKLNNLFEMAGQGLDKQFEGGRPGRGAMH